MRTAHPRLLLLAALAVAGCGGAQMQTPWVKGPMPPEGDFDGVYQSDFGRLEMNANGRKVTGLYEDDQHFGRVEGEVDGNLLTFTWTQWNEDMQGKLRRTQGDGVFQYVLEEVPTGDKVKVYHKLEGWWGYQGAELINRWNAAKLTTGKKRLQPHQEAGEEGGGDEGSSTVGFDGSSSADDAREEPAAKEEEEDEGGLDDVF